MKYLPSLKLTEEYIAIMSESKEELKYNIYSKNKVNEISENYNIDAFQKVLIKIPEFFSLIMIVDNSEKISKKINIVLSEEFK